MRVLHIHDHRCKQINLLHILSTLVKCKYSLKSSLFSNTWHVYCRNIEKNNIILRKVNEIKDVKSAGPKVLIVCVDRTQVLVFVDKISHFYHADFKNANLRGKLEAEEKLVIHFDGIDCIV